MTLDEAIAHAKELSENKSVCKDCREEHKQLAKWLEELREYKSIFDEEHPLDGNSFNFLYFKPYSNSTLKKMTELNIEHYYDKLTTYGVDGFAVTNGKVKACRDMKCSECDFNGGYCGQKRFIWMQVLTKSQHTN